MQLGPQPAATGSLIGDRYQTEGVLGQGGFGVVYAAKDLAMGRSVALKVLRPDLFDKPDAAPRFRREAELALRLEHPHTVRLLDVGVTRDGLAYIAFERLVGRPLSDVIQAERALDPARVARITAAVLSSLMEAHARGIVHRDIKPSNIFLCEFAGAPDFVKVLDFGIARAAPEQGQTRAGLTATGEVLGTPRYMAPEQALGQPITPAADLYALGLVMSEALSGEPVYKGHALTVCMEQASPVPVPHRPEVLASALGPVVQRATQKQVSARYGSAQEMMQHLQAVMSQAGAAPLVSPSSPSAPSAPPSPAWTMTSGAAPAATQAPMTMSGAQAAASLPAYTPQPPAYSPPQAPFMGSPPSATFTGPPASAPFMSAPPAAMQAPAASSRKPVLAIVGLALVAVIAVAVAVVVVFMPRDRANTRRSSDPKDVAAPAASDSPAATAPPTSEGGAVSTSAAGGKKPSLPRSTASSSSTTPTSSATPTATPSGDAPSAGTPFDINEAVAAMDVAYGAAKGCARPDQSGLIPVNVTFAPDGRATHVFIGTTFSTTPGGKCIQAAFRGARVKPFNDGQPRSVGKSYVF